MTYYFNALLLGIVFTMGHIALVTYSIRRLNKVPPVLIHFVSGLLNAVILLSLSQINNAFSSWLAFCVLSFGISAYLFVFGAIYKSLSLRILLYTQAHGGVVTLTAINESITQKSFQDRVDLLIQMGCCTQNEKGYHLSAKGENIIRRIIKVRQIFRISSLGLY